jgi:hypothetical protein
LWLPAFLIGGFILFALFDSYVAICLKEARWLWYAFLQSGKIMAIMRDSHCSLEDIHQTFETMVFTGTKPGDAIDWLFRNPQLLQQKTAMVAFGTGAAGFRLISWLKSRF